MVRGWHRHHCPPCGSCDAGASTATAALLTAAIPYNFVQLTERPVENRPGSSVARFVKDEIDASRD
jgi:hypothetical protein